MGDGSRPSLRLDGIASLQRGDLELRFPRGQETRAEAAADLVDVLRPVVARYLGVPWQGGVRLELLEVARASGANPVTGTLRHALRGFDERSPLSAGSLSYELGRLLLYRAGRDGDYPGSGPRHPDWLPEAALLPLRHVWVDRTAWLDAVAEQVALFRWRKPFAEPLLRDMRRLNPRQRVIASAQCLLRGQTLARYHPDWIRTWRRRLAEDPGRDGEEALELATGAGRAVWEERFAADLQQATETLGSPPPGGW